MPTQHRPKRERPRHTKKKADRQPPPPRVTVPTRYGDVPIIQVQTVLPDGRSYTYQDYDPTFAPPLPKGAVRGDIRKQIYCCDMPRYWHEDEARKCLQCGVGFVFSASEQKHWYETLGFRLDSVAVRCVDCRRTRRHDRAIAAQLRAAVEALRERPEDPSCLLSLAEATVASRERLGTGDVDRAVAAARKAGRTPLHPGEALFWEAACQEVAGRPALATRAYQAFLDRAGKLPRFASLRRRAEASLVALAIPV